MDLHGLTIDARRLWRGEIPIDRDLAFVDLDATTEWPDAAELPSCPVIGLGPRDHPLAVALDAVIEPPMVAQAIVSLVSRQPAAAAVAVQLLRILPPLSASSGLTFESLAYGLLQGSAGHREWILQHGMPTSSSSREVLVERSSERLTITLNDPESHNAIDRSMRDALHDAFTLAALDSGIDTIVLRAAGRTFSLGAELGEFGTTTDPAMAHAIRVRSLPAWMIMRCADRLEVQIQGGCVGAGLEMAAWGKRVIATSGAWFQLPELAMGVIPGAGGCVSLTRRIGRQRTALLILSGKRITARTAVEWGLVDEIVDQPA
jgi:enoyl-CoA hydratase